VLSFLLKIVYINFEQYDNVRHSMQPYEDLSRSKPVVAVGLSCIAAISIDMNLF